MAQCASQQAVSWANADKWIWFLNKLLLLALIIESCTDDQKIIQNWKKNAGLIDLLLT